MAITQCSECGGKVSTKAEACPHCGSPVEPQQSQINCPECEEDFGLSLAVCPHCGAPNPKDHRQSSASLQTRQSEMARWYDSVEQTDRLTPRRAIPSGNVTQAARDKSDKTFIDDLQDRKVDDIVSRLLEEGITSEQELRRRIDSLEALVSKAGIGSWISMIIGAVIFIPVLVGQPWSGSVQSQGMDLTSFILLFFSGLLIGIPVKNIMAARSKSTKLREAEKIYLATHIT